MVLEDHESCREHGGLQESGETDSNDLLAPLGKTVNISSWNRKHIKASDCDLYEQDASSFQIPEKHFYHGIPHHHGTEYLQDRIPYSWHGG